MTATTRNGLPTGLFHLATKFLVLRASMAPDNKPSDRSDYQMFDGENCDVFRIDDRKAALANGSAPISGKQWTSIRRVCLLACSRRSIGWRQASSTVQARMDQMISTANHDELRKSLEALTDGIQLLSGSQ
jgi:hypothetical protein